MLKNSALDKQEKRVVKAWKAFQSEVNIYKKLNQGPPNFMRDGIAENLRADMLSDAKLYPTRFEMITDLASGGIGAEIGVQYGAFSRFLLDHIQPQRLFLFDLIADSISRDVLDDPRTELHVGDSSTALAQTADASFDWIYIDGDHSQIGARKDTDVARQKIKPGGLLVFNDYTPWSIGEVIPYGVMPVVNELVNEGHPIVGCALAPHGYFDIAVRYQGDLS